MTKTDPADLVAEVAEELTPYLSHGTINRADLGRTLDFQDNGIEDFGEIKGIHFALSEPVVRWVDALPERMRQIKRRTERKRRETHGNIRGRVDWPATLQRRARGNPKDTSLFLTEVPDSDYDIPENLLVKELATIVHGIVSEHLSPIDTDWRKDVWPEDRIKRLREIVNRNVHFSRIGEPDHRPLRGRVLDAARRSRQPLYTEAYELYDRWLSLDNDEFSRSEVQDLLTNTLVRPDRVETLFELFCVLRTIKAYQEQFADLQLLPVRTGRGPLARAEGEDVLVEVYHNEVGNFHFHEPRPDAGQSLDSYTRRLASAREGFRASAQEFLGETPDAPLYSGRPDMVLAVYGCRADQRNLDHVLVGESKYTRSKDTFKQGLRELHEYIQFCRREEVYVTDQLGASLQGLIFTDGVDVRRAQGSDVMHLTTADLLGRPELPVA